MYHKVARASGAALGFIFNNTKGAHIGYRLGSMAAKRKRASTAATPRKRTKAAFKTRYTPSRKKPVAVKRKWTAARRTTKKKGGRRTANTFANAIAKTSSSSFSIGRGPRLFSGFKRSQLPITFTSTCTQRLEGESGRQLVNTLSTYSIQPASTGAAVADTQWRSDNWLDSELLFRMNRWLSTGTPTLTGGARDASFTNKFVVNYLRYDTQLRNMSNQDQTITLYDCVPRLGVSPNYISTGKAIDPLNDWGGGLFIQGGGQTGRPVLPTTPGTTPFMSVAFCKLYKIRKVTKKVLSSGEVHHHYLNIRPRTMFDSAQTQTMGYGQLNDRGSLIPGLSGFTIVVATGSIVNDATTKVNVTYSKPTLDVVTTCKASFASFTRERRQHMSFDGLALDASGAVYQGPLDDTDAIVAVGAA